MRARMHEVIMAENYEESIHDAGALSISLGLIGKSDTKNRQRISGVYPTAFQILLDFTLQLSHPSSAMRLKFDLPKKPFQCEVFVI